MPQTTGPNIKRPVGGGWRTHRRVDAGAAAGRTAWSRRAHRGTDTHGAPYSGHRAPHTGHRMPHTGRRMPYAGRRTPTRTPDRRPTAQTDHTNPTLPPFGRTGAPRRLIVPRTAQALAMYHIHGFHRLNGPNGPDAVHREAGGRRRVGLHRDGPGRAARLGAGVPAAAVPLLTRAVRLFVTLFVTLCATLFIALFAAAPSATAHDRPDRPPTGDNCAFAGTAPPVDVPTGFPMPRGWHFPCTKAKRPPTPTDPPAPRPRSPRPAPPPPAPPPRPSPPPPPPPTPHAHPTPPRLTPKVLRLTVSPAPVLPHSYAQRSSTSPHSGRSIVTTTLLVTAPAVLAGAALRPRSSSSSGSAGRRSS